METYVITTEPYYDTKKKYYKNVLIIDRIPLGPLKNYVKQIQIQSISPFKKTENKCYYGVYNTNNELMDADNYYELYLFLLNNSYTINTELTNMINKQTFKSSRNLLSFITYKN